MPLGLEVDGHGLGVILIPGHVYEGSKVIAIAIIDVVGVARQPVAGDGSGGGGGVRLDAVVFEPHFTVEVHDVFRHKSDSFQFSLVKQ